MDYEEWVLDGALDLGELLVAYLFVGLSVGSIARLGARWVDLPLGLTATEIWLLAGAAVIAAAEVADRRPSPVQSVGFLLAYLAVQVGLVAVVALTVDSHWSLIGAYALAALVAYVLAVRWGATGTAVRCQRALGRLTWIPARENRSERR